MKIEVVEKFENVKKKSCEHVKHGKGKESLQTFKKMQEEGGGQSNGKVRGWWHL